MWLSRRAWHATSSKAWCCGWASSFEPALPVLLRHWQAAAPPALLPSHHLAQQVFERRVQVAAQPVRVRTLQSEVGAPWRR
jgi:hypothetical protein